MIVPDIGCDDKLGIDNSVGIDVGILGLGVRLESDDDIKVGINGGNVVGIYDGNGNGSVDGDI